jgi:DNA-binding transcriptional regulator GbsR (MarR family)
MVARDTTTPMLLAKRRKRAASKDGASPTANATLTEMEAEVVGLFVQLARVLGKPRSLAEIYGLLFISGRPLAMDDFIERLKLSKGSASQGLRFLRNAGAVKMVYVPGDRRVHYETVAALGKLIARFLRDCIVPQLDTNEARLKHIASLVKQLPSGERERVAQRVAMLRKWEKKAHDALPVAVKLLGG